MSQAEKENQSIGRLISILYRQSKVYFQRKLAPYGLGHGQVPVLMYIAHHEGVTQHQVSEHFRLDKGSTSSLMKGLEAHEFIVKKRDEKDRRVFRIYMTHRTKELLPVFYEIFRGWTGLLLDGFEEDEREEAFELLNRMLENTHRHLKREEEQ
jgi:DNA-binding MarR family transcriptional regulator